MLRCLIFAILILPVFAAAAFYGNQSGVNWKSAETEHFYAHYPAEYREKAAVTAGFAENVYDTITKRYEIKLPSKVNLVLENALVSNGEANPVFNMMRIWLTGWDFKIRGTHSWISDVITHEFSHLASMQNGSKTPFPWIQGLQIGRSDFYNEKNQISLVLFFPFMIQPFWFAEGTAQYESSRMGFDSWDTHRDMILRIAFLENKILPLEFMDDFSGQALEAEQGPYTQGFDLVRYIAEVYGDSVLPKIWKSMGSISSFTLNSALTSELKISDRELFDGWKSSRAEHYKQVRNSLGELREGKKLTKNSFYNDFISVSNGTLFGVSNFGGDFFDGGVFEISKDSAIPITPKQYNKFKLKKPYLSQGMNIKKTSNGLLLAYTNYQNRDRKGKLYFDIAVADTNGNSRLITKYADAVYPDISPDGKQAVFARRLPNSTKFALSITSADSLAEPKDLVVEESLSLQTASAAPGSESSLAVQREFSIYTPKFSPDGKQIAFSFFDGIKRGVGIIETLRPAPSAAFEIVIAGNFDARDPNWSLDGKSIYYSSDETGIFNIYNKNLESGETKQITNVLGGAFSPARDSSGLYYIGYDKDGFSVYKMDSVSLTAKSNSGNAVQNDTFQTPKPSNQDSEKIDSSRTSAMTARINENFSPQHNIPEISFANAEQNYSPIPRMPILMPIFSIDDRPPDFGAISEGIAVPKLGLAFGLSDPLGKNFFQIAGLQQIGKIGEDSQSDLLTSLENRSTPITFNFAFMRTNTPSKDTVRYEDPRSYDDSLTLSEYAAELYNAFFSAGYSIFKTGDTLSLFASYDWAAFNLYQDNFKWDYHKRFQAGLIGGFTQSDSVFGVQGLYSYSSSDLFRPGTFAESFTVSESGAIVPHYRHFNLHEWAFSAFLSLSNPIQKNGKLTLSAFANGILSWNSSDSDTLDNFYLHPLAISGYPILANAESYFMQGTGTILADLRYKFPIYTDFRHRIGIFTTRDFSVSPFVQAGSAWQNHPFPFLKHRKNWVRSVGVQWLLENSMLYSVPFNLSFEVARGLDKPKNTRISINIGL